jgi:hypothetical protein
VDRRTVREELKRRVKDWRAPLTHHVPQARQLLRKVLADRLTVTPEPGDDRYATITGDGTLTKILAGIVFPKGMASPEGFAGGWSAHVPRILRPAGGLNRGSTRHEAA